MKFSNLNFFLLVFHPKVSAAMFENTGKSVDWLNEEVKEEVKHPLFEEEHYKEQDDNDYESGSLLNKQQSKNYENSNDYIPSWLQEDLAPPTTPSNNQSKKVRSTIKYKKPTKPTNSKSSEGKGWNFCCCCPKDPILYWFRVFHSLCGFMGVLSFISNLFILFDVALDFRNIIIHIYALFLCIIVVATELEIPFLLLRVNILESWVFRGLLYFFIGVISGMNS